MIHFDVGGKILNVADGSSVSIELINPIFIDDVTIFPGSYSFPFTVINDTPNRIILDYPDRLDKYKGSNAWDDVTFYFDGKPILIGSLYLLSSNLETSSLSFIINNFKDSGDVSLQDLDLEKRTFADSTSILTEAKDTCVYPQNYNYAVFPVFNPSFIGDQHYSELIDSVSSEPGITPSEPPAAANIGDIWRNPNDISTSKIYNGYEWETLTSEDLDTFVWQRMFQNYWEPDTNTFPLNSQSIIITPFVKLHYLVDQIMDYFGFRYLDGFFNEQLKRIYLYNNSSINAVDAEVNKLGYKIIYDEFGVPTGSEYAISLNENVPDVKVMDVLKMIRSLFFVTTIVNPFKRTIKIIPINEVINSPVHADWSDKLLLGYTIDAQDKLPKAFGYAEQSDGMFDYDPRQKKRYALYYEPESNTWINNVNEYYFNYGPPPYFYKEFVQHETEGTKEEYLVPAAPIFNYCPQMMYAIRRELLYPMDYLPYPNAPICYIKGNIDYVYNPAKIVSPRDEANAVDNDLLELKGDKNKLTQLRLLFYRGVYEGKLYRKGATILDKVEVTVQYPYATPTAFGPIQSRTTSPVVNNYTPLPDDYSLLWEGDKGIVDKWAREYIELLRLNKGFGFKLYLNIADILNFSFENKVRIQSNNYLVKSLRVTFTKEGVQPSEATVVRVI